MVDAWDTQLHWGGHLSFLFFSSSYDKELENVEKALHGKDASYCNKK